MNIGEAVDLLKLGKRVTRAGWNGQGMWLSLTPGRIVNASNLWSPANADYARMQGDQSVAVRSYVTMKTVDGAIVPWTCSQTDLLADDWMMVAP